MPGILIFLFNSKIGRYILSAVSALAVVGMIWIGIQMHDSRIANEATAVYNAHQQEVIIEAQKHFDDQMKDLQSQASELKRKADEAKAAIDLKSQNVIVSIEKNTDKSSDDTVPPVIRDALRSLSSGQ